MVVTVIDKIAAVIIMVGNNNSTSHWLVGMMMIDHV